MSTPHPAKRRRLDLGSVNKPFRSPLRTAPPSVKHTPSKLQPLAGPSPSPTQSTAPAHPPSPQRSSSPEIADSQHDPDSSPLRPAPHPPSKQDTTADDLSSQIALLSSHPALHPPSRLPELTRKWRRGAQQALDELLAAERDIPPDTDAQRHREERLHALEEMLRSGRDENGDKLGVARSEVQREADRLTRACEGGMAALLFRLGVEEKVVGWDGEGWREDE